MDSNYKIGEIIKASVNEVKPYAAFLKLPNGKSGMIHISELSDSYIRDIDKFVSVGDELTVKILMIDKKDNFYRCSFKQVPENDRLSTHTNSRHALETNQEEFDSLKKHIPEWIEESLKRHNVED